jgi:uncharacterized membrane protein (DUF485 family)
MPDPTPPQHATSPVPPPDVAWSVVEGEPQFRELVAAKRRFIVPATAFFIVYYFALPVLVGYYPEFMDRSVFRNINLAYLFALSQFFMAWVVMWLYVRRARHFDALEHTVVQRHAGRAS